MSRGSGATANVQTFIFRLKVVARYTITGAYTSFAYVLISVIISGLISFVLCATSQCHGRVSHAYRITSCVSEREREREKEREVY